jgi:GLPGLI family protein
MYNNQKSVFGNVMRLEDSITNLEWKYVAEDTREFAGFNCKKATAKIFDSVYVFAYYTDEITPSVGPMSIVGLPGAIMAITIPRMNMSIVAKEFSPLVNESAILPPKKSKLKSKKEVYDKIIENTKNWGKWAHKGIWQSFI